MKSNDTAWLTLSQFLIKEDIRFTFKDRTEIKV